MKKVPVVFLSADPTRTLALDEDLRNIRTKVRAAKYRGVLQFDSRTAARLDDVVQALYETKPQVVHFSGHGGGGGLMLVGEDGHTPHWVSADDLQKLFTGFRDDIRVVVLSACSTGPHAKLIADIVGCAIGTPTTIADEAAIAFNAEFYRAIAFGESVQGAYDKACSAIGAHDLDAVRPELETGDGVDPAQLFLVRKPTPVPRRRIAAGAALLVALLGMTQVLTGSEESPPPVVSLMTPPVEALATALELQRGGNHAGALPFFKRAAEAGNAEAMGYLGIAYLRGEGTERTPELAAHWLEEAAEKRDARGMNAYGQAYEEGAGVAQSYRWAQHWYEAAATEQNDVEAMRNLARLYRQRPRTSRHDSLALAWYLKAVDEGSVEAMVDVGLMYAEGVHGQRDPNQALGWFQRAADAGSPRAMHAIGRLNEEAKNYRYALAWYRKAADAGSAEAMNSLGVLYQNGWGVAPNRAEAARWYRRAARAGSPAAQASLAALERS